jgi:hypothetical protein
MVAPPEIDGLPPAQPKQLPLKLLEENAEQRRVIAELREEIARLKGLKGRPSTAPGGVENGGPAKPRDRGPRRRRRGKVVPRVGPGAPGAPMINIRHGPRRLVATAISIAGPPCVAEETAEKNGLGPRIGPTWPLRASPISRN